MKEVSRGLLSLEQEDVSKSRLVQMKLIPPLILMLLFSPHLVEVVVHQIGLVSQKTIMTKVVVPRNPLQARCS